MLIKVIDANYFREYKIEMTFDDGLKGIADLKNSFRGPVFQPLKDVNYFKTFILNRWTIEWDCGADLAPERLHEMVIEQSKKVHGETVV